MNVKTKKSPLVRKALKVLGMDASAQDIIELVKKEDGVTLDENIVNVVKSNLRKQKKPTLRLKKKPEVMDDYAKLVEVKNLAGKLGGLDELQKVLDRLVALR